MSIILDLLGALIIATLLLLMMISFQFQLQDIANRTIFSAQMLSHEQRACNDLNRIIALVGIGVAPDSTVTQADAHAATFRTRWNYLTNTLLVAPSTLQLSLGSTTGVGKQLLLSQGGTTLNDLGYILWIEDMTFAYYDSHDDPVTLPTTADTRMTIRSMDIGVTFRRDAPSASVTPLRTRVQLKVYFMNCYLQGA